MVNITPLDNKTNYSSMSNINSNDVLLGNRTTSEQRSIRNINNSDEIVNIKNNHNSISNFSNSENSFNNINLDPTIHNLLIPRTTTTQLSLEEFPPSDPSDFNSKFSLKISSDTFEKIVLQIAERLEIQPIPKNTNLPQYLRHILTVTANATTQIYQETTAEEKQRLQSLMNNRHHLTTLFSKPDNMLKDASIEEKQAYYSWLQLTLQVTSNTTLQEIDISSISEKKLHNMMGFYSGEPNEEELKKIFNEFPYLYELQMTLDEKNLNYLLDNPLPPLLNRLIVMLNEKALEGRKISEILQHTAFNTQIKHISLGYFIDNEIDASGNIPPLNISDISDISLINPQLCELYILTPICDPKVIKKINNMFPQLRHACFNLQPATAQDREEMRTAIKEFPLLDNKVELFSILWPLQNSEDEISAPSPEDQYLQQKDIITGLIHACLPDLSEIERNDLIIRWEKLIQDNVDVKSFTDMLFSNGEKPGVVNTEEYRDYRYNQQFRKAIGEMLSVLPINPDLYVKCISHAHEANTSCQDKTLLAFRDCIKAVHIEKTLKNMGLPSQATLINLGTQLFNENKINEIIKSHIATLKMKNIDPDEVEEELALITQLSRTGKINLIAPLYTMLSDNVTHLTAQQIVDAEKEILMTTTQSPESRAAIGLATNEIWKNYLNHQDQSILNDYTTTILEPISEQMQTLYLTREKMKDSDYQQLSEQLHKQLIQKTNEWYQFKTTNYLNSLALD